MTIFRLSLALVVASAALAACGDDTAGSGGGGGSTSSDTSASTGGEGGDDTSTTTSQGTGGAPGTGGSGDGGGNNLAEEYENACSFFCDALADLAGDLDCADQNCETDECPAFDEPCAAEQIDAYTCLGNDMSTAACACEGDGDIECEDICLDEFDALDTCQGS